MVRDTTEGKTNFLNVRFGPMLKRWGTHLTKGREKYPDVAPGVPNWTLAAGVDEYLRAKESAARHFEQWLNGDRDEDHASALYFNVNLAEYVLEKDPSIDPSLGATVVEETAPTVGPRPLKVGDRVRVKVMVGTFGNRVGTVETVDGRDYPFGVVLDGATVRVGFREDELELA